jgi:hypothetical protein
VKAMARRTLGFAVVRVGLRKRAPHEREICASTGAGRASARTAARATASTGARSRAGVRTAARPTASTGTRRTGARTAARSTASSHGRQKGGCKDCGTAYCKHGQGSVQGLLNAPAASAGAGRAGAKTAERSCCQCGRRYGRCGDCLTQLLPVRAPEEPVQGLRHGLLQARAPEAGRVQGLRHGLLQAWAPEGSVQGLRHGLLRAWVPEGSMQGLRNAAAASAGAGRPGAATA